MVRAAHRLVLVLVLVQLPGEEHAASKKLLSSPAACLGGPLHPLLLLQCVFVAVSMAGVGAEKEIFKAKKRKRGLEGNVRKRDKGIDTM